jgi:myosin heavy subunit
VFINHIVFCRRPVAKKRVVERRIIVGVEDMILLRDVRDRGIVDNLKDRLQAEQIYTYIGHVLVVCNPYKWLNIYEKEVMKQYVHQVIHNRILHSFTSFNTSILVSN